VQDQVLALAGACPDTRALLLDLECTDQLEITSSDMLGMLLDRLHERGIALYMVRVRSSGACFDGPAHASGMARTTSGTALARGPFRPRGARSEVGNEWALSSSGVGPPGLPTRRRPRPRRWR
jgi:hypothetical protein